MSQSVFVPASDELLEVALKEGHPRLIPYSYQQLCNRGMLEAERQDAGKGATSKPGVADRAAG